jgi:hypothetical protein
VVRSYDQMQLSIGADEYKLLGPEAAGDPKFADDELSDGRVKNHGNSL